MTWNVFNTKECFELYVFYLSSFLLANSSDATRIPGRKGKIFAARRLLIELPIELFIKHIQITICLC